jgi:hypothetical protein
LDDQPLILFACELRVELFSGTTQHVAIEVPRMEGAGSRRSLSSPGRLGIGLRSCVGSDNFGSPRHSLVNAFTVDSHADPSLYETMDHKRENEHVR